MKKMILMALVLGVLAMSNVAFAVPIGQEWNESGVGNFDRLELYMTTSNNFTDSSRITTAGKGWTTNALENKFLSFNGPDVTSINFFTGFEFPNLPVKMDFLAYNDANLLEGAKILWTGNAWNISGFTPGAADFELYNSLKEDNAAPVPEPGTIVLMVVGFAGLIMFKRRHDMIHS